LIAEVPVAVAVGPALMTGGGAEGGAGCAAFDGEIGAPHPPQNLASSATGFPQVLQNAAIDSSSLFHSPHLMFGAVSLAALDVRRGLLNDLFCGQVDLFRSLGRFPGRVHVVTPRTIRMTIARAVLLVPGAGDVIEAVAAPHFGQNFCS